MTADASQTATALLTEHLQYTPLSLIDDIINSVNELVYQGISSLENGLFSTPPEKLGFSLAARDPSTGTTSNDGPECPQAKQEIEEGLHKLETLLESTVDKNFDRFEIYVLRNILSVPEDLAAWIRLSHYEVRRLTKSILIDMHISPLAREAETGKASKILGGPCVHVVEVRQVILTLTAVAQNLHFPPLDNAPTTESVQLLRRKAAASQNVTTTLLAESSQNEAIIAQLKALTEPRSQNEPPAQGDKQPNLSFLNSSPSSRALHISLEQPTTQPLTTNTTFTLSQLPALKALLADLRPKLASLRAAKPGLNSARDERRQERRDYIEQRTRMYLDQNERAHADNPLSVNGRKVDPEEVEALEKVASTFGVQ